VINRKNKYCKSIPEVKSLYKIPEESIQDFIDSNPKACIFGDGGECLFINTRWKAFQDLRAQHGDQPNADNQTAGTRRKSKLEMLEEKALEADLEAKIYKAEIKKAQAEKERMIIDKKREDLVDHAAAKFYYFNYLDKLNLEIFRLDSKFMLFLNQHLQQTLEPARLHELQTEFRRIYNNEIAAVIRNVKEEQQKELENSKK